VGGMGVVTPRALPSATDGDTRKRDEAEELLNLPLLREHPRTTVQQALTGGPERRLMAHLVGRDHHFERPPSVTPASLSVRLR
jgi:hypothetical protein